MFEILMNISYLLNIFALILLWVLLFRNLLSDLKFRKSIEEHFEWVFSDDDNQGGNK